MMKENIAALTIIIMTILSACAMGGNEKFDNDDKIIDGRFELIVEAIENQDTNAIRSMFSTRALEQSIFFEEQIARLYEFIQGKIESWERTGGPGVSEGRNDDGSGRIWKEIRATYDIKTSEQKYHISIQEIIKYSPNSDLVGISSFCIINADDWDEDYNYWGDLGLPKEFKTLGIYFDEQK